MFIFAFDIDASCFAIPTPSTSETIPKSVQQKKKIQEKKLNIDFFFSPKFMRLKTLLQVNKNRIQISFIYCKTK